MARFILLGILGFIGLQVTFFLIILALKRRQPKLRVRHFQFGAISLIILFGHGLGALLRNFTGPIQISLFGSLGLVATGGLWLAIILMLYGKRFHHRRTRRLHPRVALISLLTATVHALWGLIRVFDLW